MKKPLVSVIVPVYKVEQYLDCCIKSIVNQTYKNIEIILVEDGSPDNCSKICDDWAMRDNRIRVVHKINGGGAQARNIALELAAGEYITFVDSDDYIAPDMYEYMFNLFTEDIDIVECDFVSVRDNDNLFDNNDADDIKYFSTLEALRENISDHYFRQLIWNKLYRREVVGNIRFTEGKKIDDEFWTYHVLGNAKKLIRSSRKLYAYRQQNNSVMHSMGAKWKLQGIEAKYERHIYIKKFFPELENESGYNLWFSCIYQGQLTLRELEREEQKDILLYLKSVLEKCPIDKLYYMTLTKKQQIWLKMAKVSLPITCRIRNILGIGM